MRLASSSCLMLASSACSKAAQSDAGWSVGLVSLRQQVIDAGVAELEQFGVSTCGVQADVTDRDGWVKADQLFTRPIDTLGPRLGRLNPAAMTRVDASLRFVLGL